MGLRYDKSTTGELVWLFTCWHSLPRSQTHQQASVHVTKSEMILAVFVLRLMMIVKCQYVCHGLFTYSHSLNGGTGLVVASIFSSTHLLCNSVVGLTTNPTVENGGTVVVAAPENAANVRISCQVTPGPNFTNPRVSAWFLTMKNGARTRIVFNSEPNYSTDTGGFQTEFNILSFGADLDMAALECSNDLPMLPSPNTLHVFFILRILG